MIYIATHIKLVNLGIWESRMGRGEHLPTGFAASLSNPESVLFPGGKNMRWFVETHQNIILYFGAFQQTIAYILVHRNRKSLESDLNFDENKQFIIKSGQAPNFGSYSPPEC